MIRSPSIAICSLHSICFSIGSILWKDLLLTNHDESPYEGMMSIEKDNEKKAIELAKVQEKGR